MKFVGEGSEEVMVEKIGYYENGKLEVEGNFKDGKKDGIWTTYNRDGSNDRVAKWKDGVKVY